MENRILVIDDESSIQQALKGALEDEGLEVVAVGSGEEGLARFWPGSFDLVLLDVWLPGMDGLEVLQRLKQRDSQLKVIMISGHGTIETAVKATKLGAYDFIEKPLSLDNVISTVRAAFEHKKPVKEAIITSNAEVEEIVGNSDVIVEVKRLVKASADNHKNIVINGERGAGKEFIARLIHIQDIKKDMPFIKVNCSALKEDNAEE